MPARTNDFQKLIKVINRHLAAQDAKITESAMLYDPQSETEREVDILVESLLLNCPIKIGIECTAAKRAVDVRTIETHREKHRNIGINQTIIVSKFGFTESAKKYAEKNYIKLLTFNSAKRENWSKSFERLKNLSIYGRNYFLKSINIKVKTENSNPDFIFDQSVVAFVRDNWISLQEYAAELFTSSQVSKQLFKELIENEARGSDPWVEVGILLRGEVKLRDQGGKLVNPDEIVIRMGYRSKYKNLNSTEVVYDGNPMVVGGFFDEKSGDYAHVAINQVGSTTTGTLEVGENFLPSAEDRL